LTDGNGTIFNDNISVIKLSAADPTPKDIAFLRSIPTIGLENYTHLDYGDMDMFQALNFDINKFHALNPKPEFWLLLDGNKKYVQNITEIIGKTPISIDPFFENGHLCRDQDGAWDDKSENADKCYFRSAIDVIKRTIELAGFLGIELDDAKDQKTMCEAAMRFSSVAKAAHKHGVRAVGMFIFEDAIFPIPPHKNAFMRTLEELGMPLFHPSYEFEHIEYWYNQSWFVNCQEGQNFTSCNDATLFNIDFWLLDRNSMNRLRNLEFYEEFPPDKAILAGQIARVPSFVGPYSYQVVARFLNYTSNRLEKAQSLYPDQGCQDIDVTPKQHISVANLFTNSTVKVGTVACFNRMHLQRAYCPTDSSVGLS